MGFDQVKAGKDVPNDINVIIEISAQGDPIKFEVDKDSGAVFVDRFMGTSMRYPINYGYVPHTIAGDGDPVDVLVVTPVPLIPGVVVTCRPIGILKMQDEAGEDGKVLAVPTKKILPAYEKIETLKKDAYFKTWMIRILINQCKDILKHRSRIQSKAEMQESAFEDSGYIDCEWKEVLSCLDEKYRIILLLYYTREMDTREIAELLDISRNTVITRLARGRKLLKRELEGGKIYG